VVSSVLYCHVVVELTGLARCVLQVRSGQTALLMSKDFERYRAQWRADREAGVVDSFDDMIDWHFEKHMGVRPPWFDSHLVRMWKEMASDHVHSNVCKFGLEFEKFTKLPIAVLHLHCGYAIAAAKLPQPLPLSRSTTSCSVHRTLSNVSMYSPNDCALASAGLGLIHAPGLSPTSRVTMSSRCSTKSTSSTKLISLPPPSA
jgi:hypothetical protein